MDYFELVDWAYNLGFELRRIEGDDLLLRNRSTNESFIFGSERAVIHYLEKQELING